MTRYREHSNFDRLFGINPNKYFLSGREVTIKKNDLMRFYEISTNAYGEVHKEEVRPVLVTEWLRVQ